MGQVTVTLNSRTYRLRCGDGEEARLAELATYVSQRIDALSTQFGQHGDERLLLMAALLMAEEMLELKQRAGATSPPELAVDLHIPQEPAPAVKPPSAPEAKPVPVQVADTSPPPRETEAPRRQPTPSRTSLEARLLQARGERP